MENSLKQRIVGAVVLVALAVIFLPAILKEKDTSEPFKSQIPQKPLEVLNQTPNSEEEERLNATRAKLDELEKKSTKSDKTLDSIGSKEGTNNKSSSPTEEDKKDIASDLKQKNNSLDKPDNKRKSKQLEDKKTVAETVTEAPSSSQSNKKRAQPETIGKIFKDAAWLIQVASFSNKENAERLVSKLKEKGFKAYDRKGSNKGRTIYRIYVGPYIEKAGAQSSLAKVDKVSQTKGIVIPFDPVKH